MSEAVRSRNSPCPCGSGKKFKRCCRLSNSALLRAKMLDGTYGLINEHAQWARPAAASKDWRRVRVAYESSNGRAYIIEFLLSAWSLAEAGTEEGGDLWLTMAGEERQGVGKVRSIEPAGITGEGAVWSEGRKAWVPVAELREGEVLKITAVARVISVTPRPGMEPVYNIEVDSQHCYRVGDQGLLVHNASFGPGCDPCRTVETDRDGIGGANRATYDFIREPRAKAPPEGRQVCRVRKVEAVLRETSGDEKAAENVRNQLRGFFFNLKSKDPQTTLQEDYAKRYAAGHLLAHTLNGDNDKRNMVPLLMAFNSSGAYSRLEYWLRQQLRRSERDHPGIVSIITIDVQYPNRSPADRDIDPLASYVPEAFAIAVKSPYTASPIQFTLPHSDSANFDSIVAAATGMPPG